jgi:hypothetical protein
MRQELLTGLAVAGVAVVFGSGASVAQGPPVEEALPVAGAVATGVVEAGQGVSRAGPSEFFPEDTDCLSFGSSGEQIWSGEETAELVGASGALSAIADANRDDVAGVALCSDRNGAAIFVANLTDALAAEIAAVADEYSALSVVVEDAAAGAGPAMDAGLLLKKETDYGPAITLVGVDVYTGGLVVSVDPSSGAGMTAESIHEAVLGVSGLDLPIALTFAGPDENASRTVDAAP